MPNYNICSIYYDMLNTPLNIDIKRVIKDNIANNFKEPTLFLVRILKRKDVLQKLYEHILAENEYTPDYTLIRMIFSPNIDFFHGTMNIVNRHNEVVKDCKGKVDSIVFITSNHIDIINHIDKKVYLITAPEEIGNYDSMNLVAINYNDYLINDVKAMKDEIKKYNEFNHFNLNQRVFYSLTLFAESLTAEKLDYTGVLQCKNFKNMESMDYDERTKSIEQYVLYFDYAHVAHGEPIGYKIYKWKDNKLISVSLEEWRRGGIKPDDTGEK